jgi:hypothetical protein
MCAIYSSLKAAAYSRQPLPSDLWDKRFKIGRPSCSNRPTRSPFIFFLWLCIPVLRLEDDLPRIYLRVCPIIIAFHFLRRFLFLGRRIRIAVLVK